MTLTPQAKKYLAYSLIAIFVMIVLWAIYTFLTTATLEVTTTNQKDTITIEEMAPKHQAIDTKNAAGRFKARLHTGTYTVTAKNGYASAQQIVKLSIGDSKKVSLTVNTQANQQGVLEDVSNLGAYATVADKNVVKFIDRNQNPTKLYQIDASNKLTNIAPQYSFDTIAWADTSFGVGHMGSQLYAIEGTSVSPVTSPVGASTFTVAPNHDVYVTDGQTLYRGSNARDFTKVFTAEKGAQIKIVSASNDSILLTNMFNDSKREGELFVLHKDGSKSETDGEAYEGVWSKSGKYLAVTGDSSTIFNDKLQKVVDLPISNVGALAWIDDNNLTYGDGNLIWKFSVDTRQATVLATTADGVGSVSQLTPSTDGSSLYVAVQNYDTSDGYTFYLARYKFNSTVTVDPLLQKVSLVLPDTPIDGCAAGYINFTKLTVTVSSVDRIKQLCIDSTKNYLQNYSINPGSVDIEFLPVS